MTDRTMTMVQIDEGFTAATPQRAFEVGADVEGWPDILPHYRWVKFRKKESFGTGVVEMAAWRPFGIAKYPTWWVSEMWCDPEVPVVHYRHIDGITKGMDVRWEFHPTDGGTNIRIVHEWPHGPAWPLIGKFAAKAVIGPVFIHAIASRTLAGVAAHAAGGGV